MVLCVFDAMLERINKPPYRIELLWHKMKYEWLQFKLYTPEELEEAIDEIGEGFGDLYKLQEISGLFTERLIEISGEYFIRGSIIQTLMRLPGIVEVNETDQLKATVSAVLKASLIVPHLH